VAAILAFLSILATVLTSHGQGLGQSVYIVYMSDPPAVTYEGGIPDLPATKPGKGRKIDPSSAHVKKFTEAARERHRQALRAAGASESQKIHSYTYALNGFAAHLTARQAEKMAKLPGVSRVRLDEIRFKTTDNTPQFLGLTAAGGAYAKGRTGEGSGSR
jgi:hypothetical protein